MPSRLPTSSEPPARCRLVNWNIAWARAASPRGAVMRRRIDALAPNILGVTEGHLDYMDGAGHAIVADADYGYAPKPGRRKIMLWSRRPWRAVDALGHADLPGGRFVAGTTDTEIGPLRVFGLCIPWMHAHVASGRRDRAAWQDHLGYIAALGPLLACRRRTPTVLIGDCNQILPRTRAPKRVYEPLVAALDGFAFATTGTPPGAERPAIDHVGHDGRLETRACGAIDRMDGGRPLSDHYGVWADLAIRGRQPRRRKSPSAP